MNEFNRQHRYHVLKVNDAQKYLSEDQYDRLLDFLDYISHGREVDNKKPLQAVVVESDWPEYEKVWSMIEERVTNDAT